MDLYRKGHPARRYANGHPPMRHLARPVTATLALGVGLAFIVTSQVTMTAGPPKRASVVLATLALRPPRRHPDAPA